jgi:HK97 gp10 family phage protein
MSFKNVEQFKKRLSKRLTINPKDNLKKAVVRSASVVREEAIYSIASGNKSGRTYVKYNPRRTHTASAAGQAPATDTGVLVSSITTGLEVEKNAVIGKIIAYADDGSGGNYAKHLEFGTTEMAARPFLQPALNNKAKKIVSIFKKEGLIK